MWAIATGEPTQLSGKSKSAFQLTATVRKQQPFHKINSTAALALLATSCTQEYIAMLQLRSDRRQRCILIINERIAIKDCPSIDMDQN